MQPVDSSNNGTSKRRYFHTFDALRFFAFLKVFLLHLPIVAYPWFNYVKAGGGIGVLFFFVLSGFLITYIICEEKERTGKLNLKNFYVRRILRIWPLYYLMVLLAYSTPYIQQQLLSLPYSSEGYEPQWGYSLFFLENYKMMIMHDHANVSPLSIMWTLCIEEHFYLVWGVLLYFINTRFLPIIIICCILLGIVSRGIYAYYNIPTIDIVTNIDLFAFGAIPAYLLIKRRHVIDAYLGSVLGWMKKGYVLLLIVVVELCSQAETDTAYVWISTLLGFMFALLIALTLLPKHPLRISDNNYLSKLGVYTYGLYLYHILVVVVLRQVFIMKNWQTDIPLNAVLFILVSLVITILCSYASYHLFEKHFLKLKRYFR